MWFLNIVKQNVFSVSMLCDRVVCCVFFKQWHINAVSGGLVDMGVCMCVCVCVCVCIYMYLCVFWCVVL